MRVLTLGIAVLLTGFIHANAQTTALLLFGGDDHKTFLGCLNCAPHSPLSICNQYGEFGSKYQPDSIWNKYGTFGSKYSPDSPWNKHSSDGPIVVDHDGNSYGYFTMNRYHVDRTRIKSLVGILDFQDDKDDLGETRDAVCSE
jgi:hypothetical protein